MARGRVKWYSVELGYGFILPYDEGQELLVIGQDVSGSGLGTLENTVEVTYEAVEGMEGPAAKNIRNAESSGLQQNRPLSPAGMILQRSKT